MSTAKDIEGRKRLTLAKNCPSFSSLNAAPFCKNPSNFDLNNFSGQNSLDMLVLVYKESSIKFQPVITLKRAELPRKFPFNAFLTNNLLTQKQPWSVFLEAC